jgi:hypothetical protein
MDVLAAPVPQDRSFRSPPIRASNWLGIFAAMFIYELIKALVGILGAPNRFSIDTLVMMYGANFARLLFNFAVLFIMSRLRAGWIALLAGIFAALAAAIIIVAFLDDTQSSPKAVAVLFVAIPPLTIAIVLATAAMAARAGRSVGVPIVASAAFGLLVVDLFLARVVSSVPHGFDEISILMTLLMLALYVPLAFGLITVFGYYLPAVLHRRRRLREAGLGAQRILTVPSAVEEAISAPEYFALCRIKHRYFRLYENAGVLTVTMLAAFWLATFSIPGWNPKAIGTALAAASVVFFFSIGMRFRKRALRILLLRPFGEKEMTQALRKFVCENIGRVGYVFTLSDKHFKPSPLLTLLAAIGDIAGLLAMYVLGPLLRNSRRIATVKSERSFVRLEKKLLRQLRPAAMAFFSGEQAFNIRSTDDWWQACIEMFMHSCDFVVVDVSKIKTGTAWELNELHGRSMLKKCVFVALEGNDQAVTDTLATYFDRDTAPPVFVYRENGQMTSDDAGPFSARLTHLVTMSLTGSGRGEQSEQPLAASAA